MMRLLQKLSLSTILLFSLSTAWANAISPQGFACSDQNAVDDWKASEKALLKLVVGESNATEFFFLTPSKIILTEGDKEDRCVYKHENFIVSFYESKNPSDNIGRITMIVPFGQHKDASSFDYRFYMFVGDGSYRGNRANGMLNELFKFEYDTNTGMIPLARISHVNYLASKRIYWAIAIVTYKDGARRIYAQKVVPK